jgi:hypothetical protein
MSAIAGQAALFPIHQINPGKSGCNEKNKEWCVATSIARFTAK